MYQMDPGTFFALVVLVSAGLFGAYWVMRQAIRDAAKDIEDDRKREGKYGNPKSPFR